MGLTVLVIDDEPDHRAMMRAVLADEAPDVRVLEASDGRMGLLRRRGVDAPLLILCDQNMPVLNGHHVFMCLGGRRRPDERWVVVSSDVAAGPLSALQAAGVDEVVRKPVVWMDMATTVRRLLQDWRGGLAAV